MNRKTGWLAILLMLAVASCGGDGPGLADMRDGPITETPEDEIPATLSTVELLTSSPQLQSDGSAVATLTAFAKNANNQVVAGVPVVFSANSGALTILEGTTNDQGIATAELRTSGDPTNRLITVTATAPSGATETLSDSVDVAVIGSSIQIQGPTSLVLGDSAPYAVTLINSAGEGIPGKTLDVTASNGNVVEAETLTTDGDGQVIVTMTANEPGDGTLTATGLPDADGTPTVTTSLDVAVSSENFRFTAPDSGDEIVLDTPRSVSVTWLDENDQPVSGEQVVFATTRGVLTPANGTVTTGADGVATVSISSETAGPATITATTADATAQLAVEFIATVADQLIVQTSPSVIGPNETSTVTAIVEDPEGNRVKNKIVTFTLTDTKGGSLSIPSAVTDSLGRAQTTYTSTSATSADDGVIITARVTDTTLETSATLTVAGRALFITFGTGNTIIENEADTTYTKDYSLFVTDSSGAGVEGATINLRMKSTAFGKGEMVPGVELWIQQVSVVCPSEDVNNNGTLDTDPFEDINGDLELSPGNVAVVAPSTITTDESGEAVFRITYPQNFGFWVSGNITATTTVAGTESRKTEAFNFPVAAGDLALDGTPPNVESPWGVGGSCTDTL
ncbi:MAG TPA: Ig-like domain-containing protein [Gammaproteobacteria bacterium]